MSLFTSRFLGTVTLVALAATAHAQSRTQPWSLQANQGADIPSQFSAPVTAPEPVIEPYQNAPMPNADLNAPLPPTPKTAQVSPSLFQPRKQFRGDGYSYGSTAQSWQEQRLKPAPGVTLKVPLD